MSELVALSTATRLQGLAERTERPDRVETSTATPFDALLDATRQNVRARTLSEVRESPEQMFEAKDVDARQQRKETLQDADTPHEQPYATNPDKGKSVPRHPSTSTDSQAEPATTRQKGLRQRAEIGGGAIATSDGVTNMALSPTNQAAVPPRAVEASTQGSSRANSSEANDPKSLNAPPAATNQSATVAMNTAVATQPGPAGGEQAIARSLGEALGAKAINEVATSPGATTTTARPTEEKNTTPQAPKAKQSAETPATSQLTKTETDATLSPFERLVRSIRLNIGERVSTARMELDPPALGRMHVEVHMRGDAVELEVRTSNEATRELVAGRADELKLALEQHGVQVRRFDVLVEAPTVGPRRRNDEADKSARRPDNESTDRRAELRRTLSHLGRLDVKA